MKSLIFKKKGFTLIELLIVIAIISMVIALGVTSYGVVQKKIQLDIAANKVESIIVEAREKTRSGYYEAAGDVTESASLCFGFKVTEDEFVEKYQTIYDRLQPKNRKCLRDEGKRIGHKVADEEIKIKDIILYGENVGDEAKVYFAPPNASIELDRPPLFDDVLLQIVIGYKDSDDPKDKRVIVLNMITGNVFIERFKDE